MQTPFEVDDDVRTKDRTRLEGVKQCFYGFRDQTQRFVELQSQKSKKLGSVAVEQQQQQQQQQHLLGLISFSDDVVVHSLPTANLDAFEDTIDDLETQGRTAIYKAVQVACRTLLGPLSKEHPAADLRVIVLTDGQNNDRSVSADEALLALSETGAVCDALLLGDGGSRSQVDENLRRLVAASEGGRCVEITGLADAFEALESPAMVSLAARRNDHDECSSSDDHCALLRDDGDGDDDGATAAATVEKKQAKQAKQAMDRMEARRRAMTAKSKAGLQTFAAAEATRGTVSAAPPPVSSAQSSCTFTKPLTEYLAEAKSSGGARGAAGKRIMKDLEKLQALPGFLSFPGIPATPANDDGGGCVRHLKVFMPTKLHSVAAASGPALYLELRVTFPESYPFVAPRVEIATPVFHYAVTTEGRVCLPLLQHEWAPSKDLAAVLSFLDALLHDHAAVDPTAELSQRSWLSELLRTDPASYYAQADAHLQANAVRGVGVV